MYPIIFEYNGFIISSYGLMLMLAFLICNYLLRKYLISINEDSSKADDIIFYAAIGGIVGSKIYYIIEENKFYETYVAIIDIFKGLFTINFELLASGISGFGGGLVFLGGLIGGMLSVTYYIYKNNMNWLETADWVAPYLALGHSIGRIGCFLVGDCYGKACDLPWAMSFPNGIPPTLEHVHPTQLYESLFGFLIFLYLIVVRKKYYSQDNLNKKGFVMYEYLFLAGLLRFLVEFIRVNPTYAFGLSGAQFISIAMMLLGAVFMKININHLNGKH